MGEPSQTTMVNTVARVTFDMRCEEEDTSRWASFARETKARADAAWDHASKASAEGDELAGTYWRGQAHALCMILGDQTQLDHLLYPDPSPPLEPASSPVLTDLAGLGEMLATEVDRLWPDEDDPGYRAQCLAEEAGEVSRAITKRRHAEHAPDGLCKGKTVEEWTGEVALELAQLVGVALDIAYRERVPLADELVRCLTVLQTREAGT
jgi:NTP pyrophosphatase (non-canonical NTP hydrolase)